MTISVRSMAQDRSDGIFLDSLGQVTNWKHQITSPGGDTNASFNFLGESTFSHRALKPGRLIEARSGSALVWFGRLDQPSKNQPWDVSVVGRAALAKDHLVVTNAPTLTAAVSDAIGKGLPWTIPSGVTLLNPKTPITFLNTVDDALGLLANDSNVWSLDVNGNVSTSSGPTGTPTLRLEVVNMPDQTMQNYHNVAVVYFYNSDADNAAWITTVTASADELARRGRVEAPLDLTSGGPITLAQAQAAGAALLADDMAKSWVDPFVGTYGTIKTFQNARMDPATIRPGVAMRVFGLHVDDVGEASLDVPIGQVDYEDATGTVQLTAVNTAPHNLSTLLAQIQPPSNS